ncbi:hypothetical protein GCM10027596_40920 [Nocardioides korecus]
MDEWAEVTSGSGVEVLHSHAATLGRRGQALVRTTTYTQRVSSRPDNRTAARRALWLGALLLTLAGLFGMHGLSDHGTEQMDSAHTPATTVSSVSSMSSVMTGTASTAVDLAHATVATVSPVLDAVVSHNPGASTGMDMSVTAMCLAVLLLTAIALIVALQAQRLRPLLFLTARPVRAPVTAGREPAPPNLYALSIQRC